MGEPSKKLSDLSKGETLTKQEKGIGKMCLTLLVTGSFCHASSLMFKQATLVNHKLSNQ